ERLQEVDEASAVGGRTEMRLQPFDRIRRQLDAVLLPEFEDGLRPQRTVEMHMQLDLLQRAEFVVGRLHAAGSTALKNRGRGRQTPVSASADAYRQSRTGV